MPSIIQVCISVTLSVLYAGVLTLCDPVIIRFLFKAKKAALINPPPVVPTMPRLMEDVVPDDRDDVDIILNTTTVPSLSITFIFPYPCTQHGSTFGI